VRYVWFSLGFFVIHQVAYVIAGVINQRYTKDLYVGADALYRPFMRDVSEPEEQRRQGRLMLPAQLVRAVAMSVVLYPVLDAIGDLSLGVRATFLGGLMFVYADVASAIPFSNTIEGLVYLRPEYVKRDVFWRIQSEAVIYSVLFGAAASWLLF
jgi:hypothetical protein